MKKFWIWIVFVDIALMMFLFLPLVRVHPWIFSTVWLLLSEFGVVIGCLKGKFSFDVLVSSLAKNYMVILTIATLMLDLSLVSYSYRGLPSSVNFFTVLFSNVAVFGWLGWLLAQRKQV